MQDRVPTLPGRVRLQADADDTTGEYFYIERADEPTIEGTPLNANVLFDGNASETVTDEEDFLYNDIRYGVALPSAAFSLIGKNATCVVNKNNWSVTPTDGYYSNEITVDYMRATYSPIISVIPTNNTLEDQERENFGRIGKIETLDHKLIAYAKKVPDINLTLNIKGV